MKEQLIDFETAKLAKEKGFDIEVINYYEELDPESTIAIEENWTYTLNRRANNLLSNWNNNSMSHYSAPTQSLLQKWLREKYEIFIFPIVNIETKLYGYEIYEFKTRINTESHYNEELWDFKTYEQALEKGLIESLKLIK